MGDVFGRLCPDHAGQALDRVEVAEEFVELVARDRERIGAGFEVEENGAGRGDEFAALRDVIVAVVRFDISGRVVTVGAVRGAENRDDPFSLPIHPIISTGVPAPGPGLNNVAVRDRQVRHNSRSPTPHARISFTTRPWTSVSRKSRPL